MSIGEQPPAGVARFFILDFYSVSFTNSFSSVASASSASLATRSATAASSASLFLFAGGKVRNHTENCEEHTETEILEISDEVSALKEEIRNRAYGFEERQGEVHLAFLIPRLICEVNIVSYAEIPSQYQYRNCDNDGNNKTFVAFIFCFCEEGVALVFAWIGCSDIKNGESGSNRKAYAVFPVCDFDSDLYKSKIENIRPNTPKILKKEIRTMMFFVSSSDQAFLMSN